MRLQRERCREEGWSLALGPEESPSCAERGARRKPGRRVPGVAPGGGREDGERRGRLLQLGGAEAGQQVLQAGAMDAGRVGDQGLQGRVPVEHFSSEHVSSHIRSSISVGARRDAR